ncbi:hypothetical protein EST38_g8175 [Candolleomyces aberdarensis]|uniref:DUF4246 domain-containing protein n=1 Tax=Candolleomyces aberdarensis TaxID=2316362 RepID=A0A4Q2DGL9_9AGAR|nr:hypothetical protein EST38_g8175 [Candolleomyces aberdarensis]
MLGFINRVTDEQEWHKKVIATFVLSICWVFDDDIIAKWRAEVKSNREDFTEKMFDYCIQELRYRAERFKPNSSKRGAIVVFNGKVVKSDYTVPEGVKLALQSAIEPLESVPEAQKDWHPGSDGKLLCLLHPSLYPLVYGKTKVLPIGSQVTTLEDCISRCGEGAVVPTPIAKRNRVYYDSIYDPYSTKFQWLPCEVDISGNRPKILSYINNLHPEKHKDLYHSIEDIIEAAIPLWEISIAGINPEDPYSTASDVLRIPYSRVEYTPDFPSIPESDFPKRFTGERENDYHWRKIDWWEDNRTLVIPEPGLPFDPNRFESSDSDTLSFKEVHAKRGRPLQIIVKIENIELTPEKPAYGAGMWHVEGQLNEHICATAIYYRSCSNITDSDLAFRQVISDEAEACIDYEQDNSAWLRAIFGCEHNEPKIQAAGAVKTIEGRLITFPNTLQYGVERFKLADRTKPGHMKIVVLFLVDPNVRIISTASVPCQRLDWWKEANLTQVPLNSSPSLLESLPVEVQDQVFDQVQEFPISLQEAKESRLKLVRERRNFALDNQRVLEGRTFSLC